MCIWPLLHVAVFPSVIVPCCDTARGTLSGCQSHAIGTIHPNKPFYFMSYPPSDICCSNSKCTNMVVVSYCLISDPMFRKRNVVFACRSWIKEIARGMDLRFVCLLMKGMLKGESFIIMGIRLSRKSSNSTTN